MDEGQNAEIGIEIPPEIIFKLQSIDEEWTKFCQGLGEANVIINRDFQTHKSEMDITIEDFKRRVIENKTLWGMEAPMTVEKNAESDNQKALEKLNEFTANCKDLRE